MLWIGKVKDPFSGEIRSEYEIEASDYYEAKTELLVKVSSNPFMEAVLTADVDYWVEPADDQPESEKCYLVQASAQRFGSIQKNYCDTLEEATDCADAMARCYDFVEILYGWPGHWQPVYDEKGDEIIGLPDHGDLIDKDVVLDALDLMAANNRLHDAYDFVKSCEAVIPAERSEE